KAGTPYELLLLDAKMPGVDGFAVAEAVRGARELTGTVVVMLTSLGRPQDAARCRELGLAAYLVKPVQQAELIRVVCAALAAGAPVRPAPAETSDHPRSSTERGRLRVLLVEDNATNRLLASKL